MTAHLILIFYIIVIPAVNNAKITCDKVSCSSAYWIDGTSACFGCLWFGTSKMTFSEAQQYCESKNSHLIEILTQDQKKFIYERLKNPDRYGRPANWPNDFRPGASWAGATRCANGKWIWDYSSKIVAPFVWEYQKRSEDTDTEHSYMCLDPSLIDEILGYGCTRTQKLYPICQLQ